MDGCHWAFFQRLATLRLFLRSVRLLKDESREVFVQPEIVWCSFNATFVV